MILLLITFLKASHSFSNLLLVICKNTYLFGTMIMSSVIVMRLSMFLLRITFLKASHSFRNRLLVICKNAYFFFFQAEDGIRDGRVTGVQTCALPIYKVLRERTMKTHAQIVVRLGNQR